MTAKPFRGIIPATPVCRAYEACVVRVGFNLVPVFMYEGRPCYISGDHRSRVKRGFRAYTSVHVVYVDESGGGDNVPAGIFSKKATVAAIPDPLTGDELRDTVTGFCDTHSANVPNPNSPVNMDADRLTDIVMSQDGLLGADRDEVRAYVVAWQTAKQSA